MKIKNIGYLTDRTVITAVEHLRVLAPLNELNINIIPLYVEGKLDLSQAKDCQLFVVQRDFSGDFAAYQEIRSYSKQTNIPIILELDDNLLELPPDHPDKIALYYSNRLFPLIHTMFTVDAILVSTPELRDAISQYNPNIFVLPNFLDTNIWEFKVPKVSKKTDKIRILYMGTNSHNPDIEMITPALEAVAEMHPNVQFVFLGIEPPESLLQRGQAEYIASKTFEYAKFAKVLGSIDADIAIAPLKMNTFNVCKSPLKFFEYSAIGLPGIYSNIAPYSSVIEENVTGILAAEDTEDWVNKLNYLIENPEIRHRIATQAQQFVKENHTLAHLVPAWRLAYERVTKSDKVQSDTIEISSKLFSDITYQLDALGKRSAEESKFLLNEINLYKQQEDKYEADIRQLKLDAETVINLHKQQEDKYEADIRQLKLDAVNQTQLLNEEIGRHKTQEAKYEKKISEIRTLYNQIKISLEQSRGEVITLTDQNRVLDGELINNQNKLSMLSEELQAIYNSRSWKLTSVLRSGKRKALSIKSRLARPTQIEELTLIRKSDLYDEKWYLEQNPDVKASRMNPATHYFLYGGFEGRDPSRKFNSSYYLETYRDVKDASINPLVHYLKFGKDEGRLIRPDLEQKLETDALLTSMSVKQKPAYQTEKPSQDIRVENIGSLTNKAKPEPEEVYTISIIIPAYNAIKYTKECIDKVYAVGSAHSFEVIVVDNASSDETQTEMEAESLERQNLSYYRLKDNLGFAGGVNFGIQQAKGQYVVILNNDTLPTSGWLDEMVNVFENNPTVGIVSPVTNYVGEGPQLELEAADIDPKEIDTYASKLKGRGVYHEPGRLVFFCVMIRKNVIEQIGLLDEGYIKGNFEDDDYCLRAILSGYKLAIAKSAFVFHHGSITFKNNKIVHSDHMELNRERFFLKAGNLATSMRTPLQLTDDPQISVIVRTLNRKHLLRKALTSLANQNFRDFAVVLVNDGGDSVQDLVDEFSRHYPVAYINHEKSKGRTAALNAGLANTKTKWVAILDDDDIVYPWHLATLYNQTLLKPDGRMFYSNYNRTLYQTTHQNAPILLKGVEPWPYDKDHLWVSNRIPMHSWLIASECFEKVGLFDEHQSMLEDFEFLVRLSKDYPFIHVDRVTCEYRFYLDGMNSMINQRGRTLEALEYIFSRHPAYTEEIEKNRNIELAALQDQIEKIDSLKQNLNGNVENDTQVIRQITKLILGF